MFHSSTRELAKPGWVRSTVTGGRLIRWYRSGSKRMDIASILLGLSLCMITSVVSIWTQKCIQGRIRPACGIRFRTVANESSQDPGMDENRLLASINGGKNEQMDEVIPGAS
ncbi:unnamed protein product [Protopolystoma xenopodis]|uniref:Uncharacterized protein n=1 Tax=Protopolystoma xenopodis TaxID=117903 RepID=A0A448X7B3_9PLAT|nr:unnamed protein product [Protopolystoma xenopodis]